MKTLRLITALAITILAAGCSIVDVTKTAKGFHQPTNPNEIEILKTSPARAYEELGDVTATKFPARDVAKMHNAMRAKAAPLGATAIIITSEGFDRSNLRYAIGVAIAYK